MRARCFVPPLLALGLSLGPAPRAVAAPEGEANPAAPSAAPEAPASSEASGAAEDAAPAQADAPAQAEADAPAQAETPTDSAQPLDTVLPCGLRVIAAQDASLPVAAVVLAFEVGTRDDPDKLPGLVHALAYHLQQGNRELAPGEAISTAHDVGGLAGMAVGAAQVRFETLVPLSQLDAQLRIESLRLRAPTISRELWLKSLSYASNDEQIKTLLPRDAMALAWQDPGMAHDGRRVGKGLGDMLDQAVAAQLARLYDYREATLVVVGPEPPAQTLARVEPLFSDLPSRPRKVITTPATPPAVGAGPRSGVVARQKGDSMVWAVRGEPLARAWAQVLCGTINRQARGPEDPSRAQVRCTYADDPRRPLLVLRALGFEPEQGPEPLIASRLARIAALAEQPELEPELSALIEAQRARIETHLDYELRTPLGLATYLASAAESRAPSSPTHAQLVGLPQNIGDPPPPTSPASEDGSASSGPPDESEGTGKPAVDGRAAAGLNAAIPELLDTRRAVLLLDEGQDPPPPATPAPDAPAAPPEPAPSEAPPVSPAAIEAKRVPMPGSKPEPKPEPKPEQEGSAEKAP